MSAHHHGDDCLCGVTIERVGDTVLVRLPGGILLHFATTGQAIRFGSALVTVATGPDQLDLLDRPGGIQP